MKTVLLTGAAGGMGYATAKRLIKKGCRVIGLDVAPTCDLPEYYPCDLTKQEAVGAVFASVAEKTERIDAIVHFAGIYRMGSLVEISEEKLLSIFEINLFGVYRVNKIFLPLLGRGSRILVTSSELAPLWPLPFTGIYGITKAALEKYAFSLAMELNLLGIRVSVLRPGAVKTPLLDVTSGEIDALCEGTKLYRANTRRFKRITDSVKGRNISPESVAKRVERILFAKHPRFLHSVNRNPLLILLSLLPKRLQLFIIKTILKTK